MDCLLCHKKIPSWRRMTTGSEFCCEEHAQQHNSETVDRLLEYEQESAGLPVEDPIHRLAALGGVQLLGQEEQREWQLQLPIWIDPRRFSPAKTRLQQLSREDALLSPRPHFPPLPAPRLVWNPAAPSVARPAARPAAGPPKQEPPPAVLETPAPAVWLWPAMHPTPAAGYRPAASAFSMLALHGQRIVVAPSRLRPVQPARMAAASGVSRLDFGPQRIADPPGARLFAMPRLARAASAILEPVPAGSGSGVRPSGWGGVRPAQHFVPVAVPVAAGAAAAGGLAYAEIQSVAPVEWSAAPACESIAFASLQKQAAAFSQLAPSAHPLQPQPWRAAEIEIGPDRLVRRFWLPAPPPARRWNGLAAEPAPAPPAAQSSILTPVISAELLVAALSLAPAIRASQAGSLAARQLPWSAGVREAPPAPLAPCGSRHALRLAAPAQAVAATAPAAAPTAPRPASPHVYPGAPGALHSPQCPPAQLSGIGPAIGLAPKQAVLPVSRPSAAAALEPHPPRRRPAAPVMPEGALSPSPRSLAADHRFRRAAPEPDLPPPPGKTFEPGGWISLHSSAFAGKASPQRPSAVLAAPLASAHLPIRSGLRAWSATLSPRLAQMPARPESTPAAGRPARAGLRDALSHRVVAAPAVDSGRWVAPQNLSGSSVAPPLCCLPFPRDPQPAPLAASRPRVPKLRVQEAAVACPAPMPLAALAPKVAPPRPAAVEPPSPAPEEAPEFRRPAPAVPRAELAMSLPAARPAPAPVGPEPLSAPTLRPSPPDPLQPVERLDIASDPLRPASLSPKQAPPASPVLKTQAEEQAGVREALEQVQRDRAGSGAVWLRRRKEVAALWWVEACKPALHSKRGKAVLTVAASLLSVLLLVHVGKGPLTTGFRALTKPLRERAYFLIEDSFQNTAAWSSPALLERRDDGLVEC
ncbi:MAG TPA: hypothetical protein VE075_04690, partial [Thermoanaerobaculia bacterium]|nr:hypothetical protein [Thermoanaerobaculia bacterium]